MADLGLTIGLFGTCGGSRWREPFVAAYEARGIASFNPQVEDWRPELADIEATHLVQDGIVLFPVTDETPGLGSIAETGFSFFQAMRTNASRYFVLMVAAMPDAAKVTDPAVFEESVRARALVRAHVRNSSHPNVFVCEALDEMLEVSLHLHASMVALKAARDAMTTRKRPDVY